MTTWTWRKSSHSESDQCLEFHLDTNLGAVRDSKNPEGPVLVFRPGAVTAFVKAVKDGEL